MFELCSVVQNAIIYGMFSINEVLDFVRLGKVDYSRAAALCQLDNKQSAPQCYVFDSDLLRDRNNPLWVSHDA
jgi:hypothetical protein